MGDRFLSSAGAGGSCARPMRLPDPSPVLDKIMHPWVQKFYPVLGLGSGEKLLWHFQTPVLYWINFGLRFWRSGMVRVRKRQFVHKSFVHNFCAPYSPPPPPNQQNDGFPLELLLKGPQTELRTLSQNCEQTLQKL